MLAAPVFCLGLLLGVSGSEMVVGSPGLQSEQTVELSLPSPLVDSRGLVAGRGNAGLAGTAGRKYRLGHRAPRSGASARSCMTADLTLVVRIGDPTPPYEQLRHQFAEGIRAGLLDAGTKLPPLRQLAADLGLAPASWPTRRQPSRDTSSS